MKPPTNSRRKLTIQDVPVAIRPRKNGHTIPTEIPVEVIETRADEMNDVINAGFHVTGKPNLFGVLVVETYEPAGPSSPDPRVDRYLAPIRRAKLEAERRGQLKRLAAAQRRLDPPWWSRIYKALFAKRPRFVRPGQLPTARLRVVCRSPRGTGSP